MVLYVYTYSKIINTHTYSKIYCNFTLNTYSKTICNKNGSVLKTISVTVMNAISDLFFALCI